MQDVNYDFVSKLVKERSGLVLSKDKIYLLESRLAPIARQESLDSVDDLIAQLRTRPDEKLKGEVVEAMTTNETLFFRDITPFDTLRDHVPAIYERQSRCWAQIAHMVCGRIDRPRALFLGHGSKGKRSQIRYVEA